MRILLLLTALVALSACRGSDDSGTDPNNGNNNNGGSNGGTTGLNVAVDSGFSDRVAVVSTDVPARVHVTNAGQPAANATVVWSVTGGGGKVAPATSTTDASGAASATWTIGDTVRINTLTAGVTGSTGTLQVRSIAGAATTVARASADSSAVVAGSSLLLAVRVVDKFGNFVAEIPVTWAATGGTLSLSSTKTGPSGRAEVGFTTTRTAATYTITATVAGLGATTFKVVGL